MARDLGIFFFDDSAPTQIYTLSLHDALPISREGTIARWTRDREQRQRSRRLVPRDRKSTRLNSSHVKISYAVFCLKKKKRSRQSPAGHLPLFTQHAEPLGQIHRHFLPLRFWH